MNESDHFIDEVTEELRRDTMFATLRKAAPYLIGGVILIVGGASYFQYREMAFKSSSEAFGTALQSYFSQDEGNLSNLEAAATAPSQQAVIAVLSGQDATSGLESFDGFVAFQSALATQDRDARKEALALIANSAGAFALLAQEQLAVIAIQEGDFTSALAQLTAIFEADGASQDLRFRVQQLLDAVQSGVLSAAS